MSMCIVVSIPSTPSISETFRMLAPDSKTATLRLVFEVRFKLIAPRSELRAESNVGIVQFHLVLLEGT